MKIELTQHQKETLTKIHVGRYEYKGYTLRDCSDDYQRSWAIEKDENHLVGRRTIKECKNWINKQ
jgi:hypothetical protein